MTAYYVRSGAGGAGTGADWTNAYTTLTAALSGKAAGDVFYVAADHSESSGSALTFTSPGTNANPCFFYCVDHSGSVPPVAADLRTTAQFATTGNLNISWAGSAHVEGVICQAGNSSGGPQHNLGTTNNGTLLFKNCQFKYGGTNGGDINIGAGTAQNKVTFENTTMTFLVTGQNINITGELVWKDTTAPFGGAVFSSDLFQFVASRGAKLTCIGVDFSAMGSGKTIVNLTNAQALVAKFIDCKFNASVTLSSTPPAPLAAVVEFIRCGSSGINYDYQRYDYSGTQTIETTIVRTGGASDGATPVAWKIVTTANSNWRIPFDAPPIAIWSDVDGSPVTATVYGIWGGGTVPNNDDIWIEAEYLGDNSSPRGSFQSGTKATGLTAATALDSDSSTWGGSTTKFKMTVTFTPQQKGYIYIYVRAAKTSSTFYIDPKVELS